MKKIIFYFLFSFQALMSHADECAFIFENDGFYVEGKGLFYQPINERWTRKQTVPVYEHARQRFESSIYDLLEMNFDSRTLFSFYEEVVNASENGFWNSTKKPDLKKLKKKDPKKLINSLSSQVRFGFYQLWFEKFSKEERVSATFRSKMVRSLKAHLADRNRIAEAYLWLVRKIAKIYLQRTRKLSPMDLFQLGVFGLLIAVDQYDPSRGTEFSTSGGNWVSSVIGREIKNLDRTVRFPVEIIDHLNRIKKAKKDLELRGVEVTIEALSRETKLKVARVRDLSFLSTSLAISTSPMDFSFESDDQKIHSDLLIKFSVLNEDEILLSLDEEIIAKLISESLENAGLTDREKVVVREIFFTENPKSQAEIGKMFNRSHEGIRRDKVSALKKIKEYLLKRMDKGL